MISGEQQYLDLLQDVLENGEDKPVFGSDNVFIRSVFGRSLRFDMADGFPVYTTKKVFTRGPIEEYLWFLKDGGNLTALINKGVRIWNEWGYKYWQQHQNLPIDRTSTQEEFVQYLKESQTPYFIPIHYSNFTSWNGHLDQMAWVCKELPKRPFRKSYYVTCWNPEQAYQMAEISDRESVVLVACHTDHYLNVFKGRLSLRVTIRSNDLFLGNPFNVCQYAALLHMYSFLCGYEPGELLVNIDDAHIYSNHFEQVKEQISRQTYSFPRLVLKDRGQKNMQDFVAEDFAIEGYTSHPTLKGDITVVGGY